MSRDDALKRFQDRGFPTTRLEDWKYTDLGNAREISERWLASPLTEPALDDALIAAARETIDAHWLVFANGRLVESPAESIDGLDVASIDDGTNEPLEGHLADLNRAYRDEAYRIVVSPGFSPEKPLGILVADSAFAAPRMSQLRLDIRVEANAKLRFVEHHVSSGDDEHYSNAITTLDVADGASVEAVRIQARGPDHTQTHRLQVTMHKDSTLRLSGYDLGGRLTRNDLVIDIVEPGADAEFSGLYFTSTGQHVDNHTRVDHRVGPARSAQEYRGILSGKSRAVWNGKAIVYAGADGTDATQANHNLLLTEQAEIDAKPELE
ncbi:MAG: SufD family Fe-S cluster assembly protein, partial [Pseudomonadota bacterium]